MRITYIHINKFRNHISEKKVIKGCILYRTPLLLLISLKTENKPIFFLHTNIQNKVSKHASNGNHQILDGGGWEEYNGVEEGSSNATVMWLFHK